MSAFDRAESLLKVHVVDTGIGIRAEEMDKLFNMFGKLLRTAEMNHEGIGMGLLISKDLVKLNGGTIDVHSDGEGQGSVFSFTLKMTEPGHLLGGDRNGRSKVSDDRLLSTGSGSRAYHLKIDTSMASSQGREA